MGAKTGRTALPGTADKQAAGEADRLTYDTEARPLWEIACELSGRIPEAELAKVPVDASTNLHHYLYGAPRVEA